MNTREKCSSEAKQQESGDLAVREEEEVVATTSGAANHVRYV
jgi:hypothetical protein